MNDRDDMEWLDSILVLFLVIILIIPWTFSLIYLRIVRFFK